MVISATCRYRDSTPGLDTSRHLFHWFFVCSRSIHRSGVCSSSTEYTLSPEGVCVDNNFIVKRGKSDQLSSIAGRSFLFCFRKVPTQFAPSSSVRFRRQGKSHRPLLPIMSVHLLSPDKRRGLLCLMSTVKDDGPGPSLRSARNRQWSQPSHLLPACGLAINTILQS
jgi:hypothetical protein